LCLKSKKQYAKDRTRKANSIQNPKIEATSSKEIRQSNFETRHNQSNHYITRKKFTEMKHNLITQTTRQLIDLKSGFIATLKNERCKALFEPVSDTIRQIDAELLNRGISPLKIKKPC